MDDLVVQIQQGEGAKTEFKPSLFRQAFRRNLRKQYFRHNQAG